MDERVAIILCAGTGERWSNDLPPKQLVDIAGEPLLTRTLRQLKRLGWPALIATHHEEILGKYDCCTIPERHRWTTETLLSTSGHWADETAILLGDVVWDEDVLAQALNCPKMPQVFGNYCEIYAAKFGKANWKRVESALQRAVQSAEMHLSPGKMWQFYNAVAGFGSLNRKKWDYEIFQVIPSDGTPSGNFTRDFDTAGDYLRFLSENPWAQSGSNWKAKSGLKIIATGTGRCGTGFVSRLLRSVGFKCGHESVFTPSLPGNVRRKILSANGLEGDSSWLAAPYLGHELLQDALIVHLVRHPKKTIQSQLRIGTWLDRKNAYTQFHWRTMPEMEKYKHNTLARLAYKYARWNAFVEAAAESHSYFRFRIEDEPSELLSWLESNGYVSLEEVEPSAIYDNRQCNHAGGRSQKFELDDIPEELRLPMLETAERYGYEWDNC